jgi:hypothetical protein
MKVFLIAVIVELNRTKLVSEDEKLRLTVLCSIQVLNV